MTAIAQPVLCDFSDQHAGLCAAYINRRQEILVRLRHRYGFPCPFAMAGLGFWSAGLACDLEATGAEYAVTGATGFAVRCFGGALCLCQLDCFSSCLVATGFKTTACTE